MKEKTPLLAILILLLGIIIGYGICHYGKADTIQDYIITEETFTETFSHNTIGNPKAPVAMVEYGDYQCDYCKIYKEEIFPIIKKNYIDTGKINYTFKDFPLLTHENSKIAAFGANCADEQGAYWEMHDILFHRQEEWIKNSDPIPSFIGYINLLQLDEKKFKDCMKSEKYAIKVANDIQEGEALKIKGTPTFYINKTKISGIHTYDIYRETIEKELTNNER